jgi:hypothetical protein
MREVKTHAEEGRRRRWAMTRERENNHKFSLKKTINLMNE